MPVLTPKALHDHLNQTPSATRHGRDAYRDLRARLQAFIAGRVEGRETADDLAQEVLLRLLRANTAELANPSAWLYRVARNVITDHYRTRRPAAPISADHPRPDLRHFWRLPG